jgi:hypothetical protein
MRDKAHALRASVIHFSFCVGGKAPALLLSFVFREDGFELTFWECSAPVGALFPFYTCISPPARLAGLR